MDCVTNTWIVKDIDGKEIALIEGESGHDVIAEVKEEYGLTGGYTMRRLTESELDSRTVTPDAVICSDLYH